MTIATHQLTAPRIGSSRLRRVGFNSSPDRILLGGLAFVVLFNGLFAALLGLHPLGHSSIVTIDDLVCSAAPLVMVIWFCAVRIARPGSRTGAVFHHAWSGRPHLAPTLLITGVLWYVIGSGLWSFYELVIHQPPFPSWADVGYLLSYPFFFCGILLLPARPLSPAQRLRVILDSLLIVVAAFIFSWIIILGPTVLQGTGSLAATVVGTAYPLFDLLLVLSLLLLFGRSRGATSWPVGLLLAGGLAAIVTADSFFDFQNLNGGYATGSVTDVGYTIGYMLIALGAIVAQRNNIKEGAKASVITPPAPANPRTAPPGLLSLVPYLAVLMAAGVMVYVADISSDDRLGPVLHVAAVALVFLALARQLVVLVETQQAFRARERAEKSLQASEHRFRAMFDQAAVGVAQSDLDGRWLLSNDRLVELYGYTRDELCGVHFGDITHPDDLEAISPGIDGCGSGRFRRTRSRSDSSARTERSCGQM